MGTEQGHPLGVTDMPEPRSARQTINDMLDAGLFDELMDRVDAGELTLTGPGGFLSELVRGSVLERGLAAELTEHLGYDKHDTAGKGSGNSRNGVDAEDGVQTEVGPIDVNVPRDRAGDVTPVLLPKNARRLGGLSDVVISLYAGGMTVRDISHHLQRGLWHRGVAGHDLHDHRRGPRRGQGVADPTVGRGLPDRLHRRAHGEGPRRRHGVRNKACYLVVGVDCAGVKRVLGIWVQQSEGAKFWGQVCTELRNRGVRDVLIACCDGLNGLPEAIEAIWPHTTVQTCTVHLIRSAMKFGG